MIVLFIPTHLVSGRRAKALDKRHRPKRRCLQRHSILEIAKAITKHQSSIAGQTNPIRQDEDKKRQKKEP